MYSTTALLNRLYVCNRKIKHTKMRRKKEASKVKKTIKAKQHSTPTAVTFVHVHAVLLHDVHVQYHSTTEATCTCI